jgi:hypothetical protein
LIALHDPERGKRAAMRWLRRWLDENPAATIDQTALAATCAGELGQTGHHSAVMALRDMAERANGRRSASGVA